MELDCRSWYRGFPTLRDPRRRWGEYCADRSGLARASVREPGCGPKPRDRPRQRLDTDSSECGRRISRPTGSRSRLRRLAGLVPVPGVRRRLRLGELPAEGIAGLVSLPTPGPIETPLPPRVFHQAATGYGGRRGVAHLINPAAPPHSPAVPSSPAPPERNLFAPGYAVRAW